MKDRQRIQLIQEAARLTNLLQRSRLTPDKFVNRFRREIDKAMAPILPKPHKPRWRKWEDVPEREQAKIIRSLQRIDKEDYRGRLLPVAQSDIARLRLHPNCFKTVAEAVRIPQYFKTVYPQLPPTHNLARINPGNTVFRSQYSNAYRNHKPWEDREGTPAERLDKRRRTKILQLANSKTNARVELTDIILNLDPTDLGWNYNEDHNTITLMASTQTAFLSKLLDDCVLAGSLMISDEISEVYKCATLIGGKSSRIEVCYIARSIVLTNEDGSEVPLGTYWPTKHYATLRGALEGARKQYAASVARMMNAPDSTTC